MFQRHYELAVVALMETDSGFVEHIERTYQAAAKLRSEADPLRLAAGERVGFAVEGEVFDPNVEHKLQATRDFLDDDMRNFLLFFAKFQALEKVHGLLNRAPAHTSHGSSPKKYLLPNPLHSGHAP